MIINITYLKKVSLIFFLLVFYIPVFAQENKDYYHLVDSADYYINISSNKALAFLDSIPKPLEENIEGRLADYYTIKKLIYDDYKDYSKMHQSNILALKYAKKEKNYEVAGQACIDLFSDFYFVEKDSSAYKYLGQAKQFYKKANYSHGLLEVQQIYPYAKFLNGDYDACNKLILKDLEAYKNVKDDSYFYMFATYMLTSNYIVLENFGEAYKYFNEFKSLKNDPTTIKYNYLSFEAAIDITMAEEYFYKKEIDSTLFYLNRLTKLKAYMGDDVTKSYYDLFVDFYKNSGNIDKSKTYIDSLMVFEDKMYKNNINSSFQLNDALLKPESELQSKDEKALYLYAEVIGVSLFLILLLVSILYVVYYKKHKEKIATYSNQTGSLSYLKSNNEQLMVKVQGLEGYIKNLKKEVKQISTIESLDKQRIKIKGLYKNLHINSSRLLDKSENHLDLVNDLNVGFFKQIQETYPQLSNSDIIICYYLFIGFKNREIALFLNTSVRAIESKRYRITKKINLVNMPLLQHLKETF